MKSFSLSEIPDELWKLLLETLPRSLSIDQGILRLFEQRVVKYFDDEQHIRRVLQGALAEDDPTIEEIVEYYYNLTEKYS